MKKLRSAAACVCFLAVMAFNPAISETGAVPVKGIFLSPTGSPAGTGSADKPLDIATGFSPAGPVKPGDTLFLQPGTYDGPTSGIKRLSFVLGVSGTPDNPIRVMPAPGAAVHLNGTLSVTGSYVSVIGLEIGDLTWDLREATRQNEPVVAIGAARGVRIVNCNLFGGWNGIEAMAFSRDTEFAGCLVHDFGNWLGHKSAGGSAFYVQNREGVKVIRDCLAYRSAGLNAAPHGTSGFVLGIELVRNIITLGGAAAPSNNYENLFVSTGMTMDRISVVSNVFYQPDRTRAWKANVRMSSTRKPTLHKSAVFSGNYVAGAPNGLRVSRWENFTATGNTIWTPGILVEISSATTGDGVPPQEARPDLAGYTFSGNRYYLPDSSNAFVYSNHEIKEPTNDTDKIALAQWQKLGLDRDCQILPTRNGRPTGTRVFVFPNRDEPGRAHAAVFNWDGAPEVAVDLSPALATGTPFRIYNILDIRQTIRQASPVLTGRFDGNPVKLPMRKDPVSPDFDAFLVLPGVD